MQAEFVAVLGIGLAFDDTGLKEPGVFAAFQEGQRQRRQMAFFREAFQMRFQPLPGQRRERKEPSLRSA